MVTNKGISIFRTALWRIGLYSACLLPFGCGNHNKEASGDKFADHVRTTAFQEPAAEMAGFNLPPGFEITLFASEPDISKPINMEFDDQGRLWVTQSSEYPVAAGPGAGKDRITILEDSDGDGKADVFTHFDDQLNIPIGIMPVADGAVGFSIPHIYRFRDADNDGKAEKKDVLVGPFGYNDTHGMVNNFIRGYDGWIHACHGFTNVSTVAGTDGDSITMVSGNTFRFRLDGSRVEQTTNGRINPFGSALDERGYLYSVDCHSKPIFQLIPGGDYPQWGRKDPAIGYAPEMMSYELGSTALSGLVHYTDQQFPEAYRNSFYTGDVVTCRIDRNTVTYQGTTPIAKKEEPFLTSDDPWFRPVDIKTGPDGSLYIADFYNRIIGHYEVALDHPGRDRLSGRIWKITYTGKDRGTVPVRNWATASLAELVAGLDHPHLSIRLKIADRLVDVFGEQAVAAMLERVSSTDSAPTGYIHALWALHRLHRLPEEMLAAALGHRDGIVRQHALRILAESDALTDRQHHSVVTALSAADPFIQRTAAEVLNRFPDATHVAPLLTLYTNCPAEDTHLKYTALLAIRNNLRGKGVAEQVSRMEWGEAKRATLALAMRDVEAPAAATFVLDYLLHHDLPLDVLQKNLAFVGRYARATQLAQVVPLITEKFANDKPAQLSLFLNIQEGVAQRGVAAPSELQAWGAQLARHFLDAVPIDRDIWKSTPQDHRTEDFSPWAFSDAFLTNVAPAFRIYLSERNGYKPRATLYTKPFKLPAELRMNVFDNDVHNSEEKVGTSKNVVRIRLADDHRPVAEYRMEQPPHTKMEFADLIKSTTLHLHGHEGKMGYLEVVDSSETGSIGIGKLEPEVVVMPAYTPSDIDEQRQRAAEIAGTLHLVELHGRLVQLLQATWINPNTRLAAAGALATMPQKGDTKLLGTLFANKAEPAWLREQLAPLLAQLQGTEALQYLAQGMEGSARPVQLAATVALAASPAGINHLLEAVDNKHIPTDLLAEFKVKELLEANAQANQHTRIQHLLAQGEDERVARKQLIEDRIARFEETGQRVGKGQALFESNCAICHQIGGKGSLIGPQLDGIGNWGVRALTEKVLDPNRNISESFRTYNITLNNGKKQSGLYRRTEGEVMVFADISGKEFNVAKKDMASYTPSPYTLMPDQFRHTLSEDDFGALMEYLLSVK
ncbi:PVC-type heme-binding CxxCH protein [Parapedobacter sp. 10938]|uniref:PVC-type heme-binding CxxCH protein n=1 Tax=Parapedobacter flavus TaxID=3110225 RepID=UPI002DB9CD99|nr:PVC-type heme-binding CxxCH protein [Parapedobacter sp. 10938]MEC3879185.1 PVC-type heme-binding CxxCH protein [Parapedobacter sp. 10938]